MNRPRVARAQFQLDRRSFVGIAVRAATAIFALPAASSLLASCGGSEERAKPPAPSAPAARPVEPVPAPAAPKAEAPAPAPAQTPPSGEGDRLVTEVAAAAVLVQALQYVNPSPRPDQNCADCQLYTALSGGVGKCQLFTQGLVQGTAWCTSWAARVETEAS